ncbi:MAG: hypothetical protein ACQERZ_08370, partial [Fusobacteriota bacterium]
MDNEKFEEQILEIEKVEDKKICGYPTKSGTPCKNEVEDDEEFCYLHKDGDSEIKEDIKKIKKNISLKFNKEKDKEEEQEKINE